MERTRAIFQCVFSLPLTASQSSAIQSSSSSSWTHTSITEPQYQKSPYKLSFHEVEDGISDANLLKLRQDKEKGALVGFQNGFMKEVRSFQHMHRWIYSSHKAYSTSRYVDKNMNSNNISNELLKTYWLIAYSSYMQSSSDVYHIWCAFRSQLRIPYRQSVTMDACWEEDRFM